MSIRVIAQSNVFTTKRTEKSFEQGTSLQYILDELKIGSDNPVRISINGVAEVDLTTIPASDSLVLIKVIPTGEENIQFDPLGMLSDFIDIAIGSTTDGGGPINPDAAIIPISASLPDPVASAPIPTVTTAVNTEEPKNNYVNKNAPTTNYLSGGKNGYKIDGTIPVILGKHRYYPYQIALPYTELTNISTAKASGAFYTGYAKAFAQKLHQVYLWGHKEVTPFPDTYKRKDTLVSNLVGTLSADDALDYYGTKAKKFLNVGKTLKKYIRDVENNNNGFTQIKIILPDNISKVSTTVIFGNFYAFGKGDTSTNTVGYSITARVEVKLYTIAGTYVSGNEYRITGPNRQPSDTPSVTSFTIDSAVPDPNQQYYLLVRRLNDDPTDNPAQWPTGDPDTVKSPFYNKLIEDYVIDCTLSHVTCVGVVDAITASAQATFKYTDLVLTDISKDKGTRESILTGEIDNFNAIVQTKVPIYNGTPTGTSASWSTTALTSNPAAMFLYVLQGSPNVRPVPDGLIDWEALEEWYTFCEDNSFECNLVLENPGTIENILALICTTGRSALNMTDQYSVVVDKPRVAPTQMFTNKNSFGITSSRTLLNDIHAIEYSFINEDADYQAETGWEYREGYNETNATLKQSESVVGITNAAQVSKLMKYGLNCAQRRIDTLSVSMDVEYVLCQRGDLVYVAYDELLQGLARGRIKEAIIPTTEVTEIVLDELVTFEVGETYGIVIRVSDEVQTTPIPVKNPATVVDVVTDTLEFVSPVSLPIEAGNLYTFGVTDLEKEDYIVVSVTPGKGLTANITLINYAPEVYDLGTLTPFESKVSLPAGFGSSLILGDIYKSDETTVKTQSSIDQLNTVVSPSLKDAIRGGVPSAVYIRDDVLEVKLSNNYLYFVDKTDLKVYRATTIVNASREVIVDEPVKNFAIEFDDSYIVYSSLVNGNKLYKKDLVTLVVTPVTTVIGTQPAIANSNQIIYINNSDRNKVYLTSVDDDTTGELVSDFPTTSIDITGNFLTWMDAGTGFIFIKDIYDGDLTFRGDVFRELASSNVIASPPGLWQAFNINAVPVYVDSNTQISYVNKVDYYGEVSRHAMDIRGNYVFVTFSGEVYFVSLFGNYDGQTRLDANIVTQGFGENIICSTEVGSNKLTNITILDIDKFSVGNTITATGIPVGTKVTIVGSGYVIMDNTATITNTSASVNVSGTIQCSTVVNSTKISDISVEDIVAFSWNDSITGEHIRDGALVKFVGSDYIIINKPALATDLTSTIDVIGTRLLLDANKVVITGSIQARLLETNAINSIDRVATGNPNAGQQLYQHDLSNGIERQYRTNGELIRQFTPDDGLWLREGIRIGGTAPGGGTEVPTTPSFTDTFNQVFRQATPPSGQGEVENDTWYDTSTGVTYAYKSLAWVVTTYTTAQLDALDIDAGTVNNKTVDKSVPADALFTDTLSHLYTISTGVPNTGGTNPIPEVGGFKQGDVCKVSDSGAAYVYDGSAWQLTSDIASDYFANGGAAGYTPSPATGSSWGFDSNGKLTCSGASIQGTLEVGTTGNYSGILDAGELTKTAGSFTIDSSGNVSMNNLKATSGDFSGIIRASGGTFSGNITASGTITGGTISGATISGGTVLSTDNNKSITLAGGILSFSNLIGGTGSIYSYNDFLDGNVIRLEAACRITGRLRVYGTVYCDGGLSVVGSAIIEDGNLKMFSGDLTLFDGYISASSYIKATKGHRLVSKGITSASTQAQIYSTIVGICGAANVYVLATMTQDSLGVRIKTGRIWYSGTNAYFRHHDGTETFSSTGGSTSFIDLYI